jgi:hypothetical protein
VNPVTRYAALASCADVVLAACAISLPHRTASAATARPAPRRYAPGAACPAGRLLPHGGEVEIEWVDFLQFGGRTYIAGLGPAVTIGPSQLGPVITRIRCSLAASGDHRHVGFPLVDGSAAFLPAGAAVFEVHGFSPRCRPGRLRSRPAARLSRPA